ncbi:universal stress protein [Nesterenkonia alkaliphila]|uniref:Universal stress protein n=1 Tax=Nesterenkonia alkaliphila TaxID=1463631 RepID=A0A7K1UIP0_9MICC|nr:universal stress protein [Nesterenkonia alkaliphila]MVT26350.1 universal stress protein [Nesterenkonia alkaliphila]GFZ88551.1 universal stress protein UspA [Nesterenkonia alkaliphila]
MIPESTGVVVGVDGSEQSLRAAHWAAAEAHRRELGLTVVTAYSIPAFAASSMDGGYAMMDDSSLRAGAEKVMEEAKQFLRDYPGEVTYRIESGDPTAVLLEYSESAEVLVVGSRGRGGFFGRLLGSVSSALPAHAKCPTVLVPLKFSSKEENAVTTATGAIPIVSSADQPGAPAPASLIEEGAKPIRTRDRRPVVAGVDGSDYGRVAALTAAQEAAERGTKLRLVCALPPLGATLVWIPTHIEDTDALAELQEKLNAGRLWLNSHFPDLEIDAEVIDGTAVDVLVAETRSAQLTVLGTRGRGGFAGMLLGSTSQGVLQHAEGPLMVVPEGEDERIENRPEFGPVL